MRSRASSNLIFASCVHTAGSICDTPIARNWCVFTCSLDIASEHWIVFPTKGYICFDSETEEHAPPPLSPPAVQSCRDGRRTQCHKPPNRVGVRTPATIYTAPHEAYNDNHSRVMSLAAKGIHTCGSPRCYLNVSEKKCVLFLIYAIY